MSPNLTADTKFCSENVTFESWALESFKWNIDESETYEYNIMLYLNPEESTGLEYRIRRRIHFMRDINGTIYTATIPKNSVPYH